jgi:hypothetical protein
LEGWNRESLEGACKWRSFETQPSPGSRSKFHVISKLSFTILLLLSRASKIKVIHAGWLRDPDTWPSGAVAPDSDQDPAADQPRLSQAPPDTMNLNSPNTISQGVPTEVDEINVSGLVIAET